jgi:predicted kinase
MRQPTLFLMVGYPGAGKTTVAKILHELTGAVHLWADHERSRRFVQPTHSHEENLKLYAALNRETQALLHEGKSVIFDTNFNFRRDREKLRRIAIKEGAQTIVVWLTTDRDLAKQRAVKESHGKETRIWGNMPPQHFERISNNLQPPHGEPNLIELDGTHITPVIVKKALDSIASKA